MADAAVTFESFGGFERCVFEFIGEFAAMALAFVGFEFSG
jgi:hypothetical protein